MSMRKLELITKTSTEVAVEDGCLTRRAILATLAAAALTACSGATATPETQSSGGAGTNPDDGGTSDDGSVAPDDAGSVEVTCPPAKSKAGSLATFPQGKWKAMGAFIVGHDANGLFAFSTSCTHQGCAVGAPSSTGATSCPCHGARFDGNGAVLQGPAKTPLPHFQLTVCNGDVYVDTNKTVVATTRTPAA